MPLAPPAFRKAVLRWFDQHGRHDLPWQHDTTPYRVWVSEIMLQQTQVATVIPYYRRFLQHFPTVQSLAAADADAVLHLWTGLGYYSRARNLHRTAQAIVQQHGGHFPDSVEALSALPGIGRSTAGAIVSIAFGRPAAILDGNVKRVLARYHAVDGAPADSTTAQRLWQLAEAATPRHRSGDYAQAMMDLGATVCTRSNPSCAHCPLMASCAAFASGDPTAWPRRKARKPLPQRQWQLLLLTAADGSVLLQKRPPQGIWGGLWAPPVCEDGDIRATLQALGIRRRPQAEPLPAIAHAFSHFRVTLQPLRLPLATRPAVTAPDTLWYNGSQRIGLPAPVRSLLPPPTRDA